MTDAVNSHVLLLSALHSLEKELCQWLLADDVRSPCPGRNSLHILPLPLLATGKGSQLSLPACLSSIPVGLAHLPLTMENIVDHVKWCQWVFAFFFCFVLFYLFVLS